MSQFLKLCSAGLLLAAASLAAQATDAPAAAPQDGADAATFAPNAQVVVRDAATGRLRAPTESEAKTLHDSGASLRRAAPQAPLQRSHYSGAKGVRLTEEFMSYSVVIKQPDGRLVEYCFANSKDAEAAVAAPVSAPQTLPTE